MGETFTLPDPWYTDGHDERNFWIWNNDVSGDVSNAESAITVPEDDYYSRVFSDESKPENYGLVPEDTSAGSDPEASQPKNESKPTEVSEESKESRSGAQTASLIVSLALVVIIVGGAVFLLIRRRRNG